MSKKEEEAYHTLSKTQENNNNTLVQNVISLVSPFASSRNGFSVCSVFYRRQVSHDFFSHRHRNRRRQLSIVANEKTATAAFDKLKTGLNVCF